MAGFDYEGYLNTEHWHTMRRLALDAAEERCQLCYSPQRLQVHHRTYERLGHERMADLTVLCDSCHEAFHRTVRAKQGMQGVDLASVTDPQPATRPRGYGERAQSLLDIARGVKPPEEKPE